MSSQSSRSAQPGAGGGPCGGGGSVQAPHVLQGPANCRRGALDSGWGPHTVVVVRERDNLKKRSVISLESVQNCRCRGQGWLEDEISSGFLVRELFHLPACSGSLRKEVS